MSVWSEPAHLRHSLPFHMTYGLSAMWLLSSFQILKARFPFLHFCWTCQMPGNVGAGEGSQTQSDCYDLNLGVPIILAARPGERQAGGWAGGRITQ